MPKRVTRKGLHSGASSSKGLSFGDIAVIAGRFPGVVETTSYGTRALKVGKTLLARLKEDGETLVLKMDIVSRDFVLREQPAVFFMTDHYRDYPYVLVRLAALETGQAKELLEDAWRLSAPKRLVLSWDARE